MTDEFTPTHRYLGGDNSQYEFVEGEEVMYIADWVEINGRTNSDYQNAAGMVQTVYDDCMEELK